ncbi:Hypp7368 [Branchiostoma lanceolatum]|uniref:Hypp7368 protein n=1 Tax=Branchiostoma lanceolatum TaxID=7740 RepID=A0A8J9Z023_BRALA|nr:Hypp7368 [Branchiostoma lanceolatum]
MIRQNKGSKKIRYVVKDSERQGRDQGRTDGRGLGARAALGSQRYSTATHTTRYGSYGASATQYESPQRTPTPGTVPREIRPTGGRWGATGGVAGASVPSVTGSWRDKQHGGLGRGRSPATGMASGQGLYRTTTGRDVFPTTPGRSGYQPSRRTASPMRSTPDTRRGTPQAGQGDRMDGGFVLVQGEMEEMKRGRYGNFIRSTTPAHRVGTPDIHTPSVYSKSLNTPSFEPREAQKSRSADVPPQTVRHSGITQRGFSTQPAPVATTTTTKYDRPKGAVSAELPLGTTTSKTESVSEGYVVVRKTSDQESQAEDSSNVGVRADVRAKEEDKPAKGEETKDIRAPHKRSWNEAIGTDDNAKEGTLAPQSKEVEDSSKTTDKDDKVGDGAKVNDRPTEREENKDNRDGVGAKVEDEPTKGQEDKDYRVGNGAKVEDKIKPSEREENKHNRDDVFAKDEDKPTEDPSSPHKRSWDEAIGTEDNAKEGTLEKQTEEVITVPDTILSQSKAILVTPPPPQSKVKIRRTSSEEAPIPTDLPSVEKVERQVEPPESPISQDIFKKNQHQVRALETEGEEETCQAISPAPEKPPMPEDDVQVKPKASVVPPIHPPEVKTTTQLSSGTDTQSQHTVSYNKEETILGAKPPFHSKDVEASATLSLGSQPTVSLVEGDDKLVEETVQPFHIKAKATVVPQDPSPSKVKVMRKSSLESQPLPEFQTIDKLECEVKPQEPLIKTDPLLKNQQQVKVQTTDEEEETLETFGPSGQKPERPADAVPSRAKASLVAPPACPDVTASVTPSAGEGQEQGQPPRDNKQICVEDKMWKNNLQMKGLLTLRLYHQPEDPLLRT